MSKIGKKPIEIKEGTEVKIDGNEVTVKGPKGQLSLKLPSEIKAEIIEKSGSKQILLKRVSESKRSKAFHGLYRSLINNMIQGVNVGFEKKLEIHGLGFKASLSNTDDGRQKLILGVGFSHPVEFIPPSSINLSVSKNIITVSGIDKQLVGQVAASIRAIKPPEPYKGKGIRYAGERVRRKVGKAVVKGSQG